MQVLRFKRYSALFKTALLRCFPVIDLYKVFYKSTVNSLVSWQLRKDLIN